MSANRHFTVLGGLGVEINSAAAGLGTRKQRVLLAQLILADGDPVSADRLIDGVWGDAPPDRAAASLQAYISGLRKTLEPERPPRAPPSVVLTRGSGYLLSVGDDDVDLRRFRRLVEVGRDHAQNGEFDSATTVLAEALEMYRPLLPEFTGMGFRDEAAVRMDRMLAAARELSFESRLHTGDIRLLATELEAAVGHSPLDEGLWALLATALYRLGRQSAALESIAAARRTLNVEIGVDPGPRLRQLERDILSHAPELDVAPRVSVTASAASQPLPTTTAPPDHAASTTAPRLVGRTAELAVLHRATVASLSGPGGVVIVEGEPGAGKTALVEEACLRATEAAEVQIYWGRCVPGSAAPSMWPWVQALSAALPKLSAQRRAQLLDSDLGRMVTQGSTVIPPPRAMPDAAARFRFYDQATDLLVGIAESVLSIIVIDDLQWADAASLELLAHMAARRTSGVTFVVTLRSAAHQRPSVTNTLAGLSRLPDHHRISLGPLTNDDIAAIIRRETQHWPSAGSIDAIATRTGGNAFFVRELARILADPGDTDDGGESLDDVAIPSGVRDVVLERLRPLTRDTTDLLEVAALIGSTVDLSLLAGVRDLPVDDVLEALDRAAGLSLIEFDDDDPYSFAFSHDLIREVIVDAIPRARARRTHLAIADHLDGTTYPNAAAELAQHLWSAAPLADRRRTATALLHAGTLAVRSYRFDTAEQQLLDAGKLARAAGDGELELQALSSLLASVVSRQGYFAAPDEWIARARELADALDPRLAANLDYARFAAHSQIADTPTAHRLAVEMAERAAAGDDPTAIRIAGQMCAIDAFDAGDFGRADRLFIQHVPVHGEIADLRADQVIIARGFHGLTATMHRGPLTGRAIFEQIEVGRHDPVSYVGVAVFAVTAAALAGDAEWVLDVGARLLTGTDHGMLDYLRSGGLRTYWWARAMTGDHTEAIEQIAALHDPDAPDRTGGGLWRALYAEALIAAGRLEDVPALLAQAAEFSRRTEQHYPDAHRRLIEAKFARASGDSADAVAQIARDARSIAVRQEATVLIDRIDAFLDGL